MKRKMVWLFRGIDDTSSVHSRVWGTCPKWAAELEADGIKLTRRRVMWVGKLPDCPACYWELH